MAKRIASTVLLWLLLFAVLWWFRTGGAVVVIVLVSVLTLRELYKLMAAAGNAPFQKLGKGHRPAPHVDFVERI